MSLERTTNSQLTPWCTGRAVAIFLIHSAVGGSLLVRIGQPLHRAWLSCGPGPVENAGCRARPKRPNIAVVCSSRRGSFMKIVARGRSLILPRAQVSSMMDSAFRDRTAAFVGKIGHADQFWADSRGGRPQRPDRLSVERNGGYPTTTVIIRRCILNTHYGATL